MIHLNLPSSTYPVARQTLLRAYLQYRERIEATDAHFHNAFTLYLGYNFSPYTLVGQSNNAVLENACALFYEAVNYEYDLLGDWTTEYKAQFLDSCSVFVDCLEAVRDSYPILDEDDYYRRESEAAVDYVEHIIMSDVRKALSDNRYFCQSLDAGAVCSALISAGAWIETEDADTYLTGVDYVLEGKLTEFIDYYNADADMSIEKAPLTLPKDAHNQLLNLFPISSSTASTIIRRFHNNEIDINDSFDDETGEILLTCFCLPELIDLHSVEWHQDLPAPKTVQVPIKNNKTIELFPVFQVTDHWGISWSFGGWTVQDLRQGLRGLTYRVTTSAMHEYVRVYQLCVLLEQTIPDTTSVGSRVKKLYNDAETKVFQECK